MNIPDDGKYFLVRSQSLDLRTVLAGRTPKRRSFNRAGIRFDGYEWTPIKLMTEAEQRAAEERIRVLENQLAKQREQVEAGERSSVDGELERRVAVATVDEVAGPLKVLSPATFARIERETKPGELTREIRRHAKERGEEPTAGDPMLEIRPATAAEIRELVEKPQPGVTQ